MAALPQSEVEYDAGAAESGVYEGYASSQGWQYDVPVPVLVAVAHFESGFDPLYVSEDGKHFGLGAVGLPSDSLESAYYQTLTGDQITEQKLLDPMTNLKVMTAGLEARREAQAGSAHDDWYAAAAAYAGNADASGVFNPNSGDPYTGVTGQAYYDAIKQYVHENYPDQAAAIDAGYAGNEGANPKTPGQVVSSVVNGAKDAVTSIPGAIQSAAVTIGFVVAAVGLVAALAFVTSKALSSSDGGGAGGGAVKTAAKLALL